jgi:hypothetical protein
VTWILSLPAVVLVLAGLALTLLVAVISRLVIRSVVPSQERDHISAIAAPLMPALGAVFGVLMAITLSGEAGYLRSAQDIVSTEAASAARLGWAATSPGVDTEAIQGALLGYLRATRAKEWRDAASADDDDDDPTTAAALAELERVVRAEAAQTALGTPASTELLASVDAVTAARRARIAAASRQLPTLYVVTVIASGIALIADATALTHRSSVRTSSLVGGLAAVVGLSLALLLALTGPWTGALVVSGHPVDLVVRDLDANFFHA